MKILRLRIRHGGWLLTERAIAHPQALPLFLDKLVPQWAAIVISVTAVLFVGEIIPAAIFTGPSKMRVASMLSNVVWAAVLLMSPLAFPLGWILDRLIPSRGALTSRAEVRALVDVQRELAAERGAPQHARPRPPNGWPAALPACWACAGSDPAARRYPHRRARRPSQEHPMARRSTKTRPTSYAAHSPSRPSVWSM